MEKPMTKMLPLFLLAACGSSHNTSPDATVQPDTQRVDGMEAVAPRVVIVSGDFGPGDPGVLSEINPETMTVITNVGPQGAVGDDPVLRRFGTELFVINRSDGNNITILDANTFALVDQLGTGASSNPQDVAVVGDKLYVPTFGTKGVTLLTRGTGAMTIIDLSADDPDGKPNCSSAIAVGTDVYVACELLDNTNQNLPPEGPGKVYVIDSTTDTITHTITLANVNPFGLFEQSPVTSPLGGDLVITTDPFQAGTTGCVERVSTGATPAAHGCVVANTDLGGYASRIDFQGTMMWIAVAETFPNGALRGYDLGTSTLGAAMTPAAEQIVDAVGCPDRRVAVADGTSATNGVRIYNGATEVTAAPLAIGLVPASSHGLLCY
jgi:hypothetical protein